MTYIILGKRINEDLWQWIDEMSGPTFADAYLEASDLYPELVEMRVVAIQGEETYSKRWQQVT